MTGTEKNNSGSSSHDRAKRPLTEGYVPQRPSGVQGGYQPQQTGENSNPPSGGSAGKKK